MTSDRLWTPVTPLMHRLDASIQAVFVSPVQIADVPSGAAGGVTTGSRLVRLTSVHESETGFALSPPDSFLKFFFTFFI